MTEDNIGIGAIDEETIAMIRAYNPQSWGSVSPSADGSSSELLKRLNPKLIELSHRVIKEQGLMYHVDRIAYKNSLRIFVLKEVSAINRSYSDAVVEYLWSLRSSSKPLWRTDEKKN